MTRLRAFWGLGTNVGDTLTPVIIEHFTKHKVKWVSSLAHDKVLLCGSILEYALPGDTIAGAGHYRTNKIDLSEMKVLALRGSKSGEAPVYGDPAVLLPLIYNPKVSKTKDVGFIPHLRDQDNYSEFIDVNLPWKDFVRQVLSCRKVVSSSLHGFIIAQAYGVEAEWIYTNKVPGGKFKWQDYLTGVEGGIEKAQKDLLKMLEQL